MNGDPPGGNELTNPTLPLMCQWWPAPPARDYALFAEPPGATRAGALELVVTGRVIDPRELCLMLEPGARVSHAAVALAARVGCLLVWIGEAGVRLYSAGQPGGARADRLLHQARLALDPDARLKVVRKMYDMRFGEPAPQRRSVDQLRGIEGARVKRLYEVLARQHGVKWKGRRYDPGQWQAADLVCQANWRKAGGASPP